MKTKYLAILLCAAFVLPGCNDSFLDRIPLDELTDETYWETEEHLILASNACINYLRGKSRSVDAWPDTSMSTMSSVVRQFGLYLSWAHEICVVDDRL